MLEIIKSGQLLETSREEMWEGTGLLAHSDCSSHGLHFEIKLLP